MPKAGKIRPTYHPQLNARSNAVRDYVRQQAIAQAAIDWSPDGHWTEDFAHENGNYFNTCCKCERQFKGHKRRVICKSCQLNPAE